MRDKVREAVRLRVGANVRKLRKLKGWSQEELAERVGNTHRHIGQVERGEVNVTIDYLIDIAANLSVDPMDLFRASASEGGRVYMITQETFDQLEQVARVVERLKR
jgi:transcriptional regulator with XRE-family HTH domain